MYTHEMIESCAHALREYDYAVSGSRLTMARCQQIVLAIIDGQRSPRSRWDRGAHDVVIAVARTLGWPRA